MLGEVEVGAVGDAFQLTPAPGVEELDVGRAGRVVRQLVGVVLAELEHVLGDAEVEVPAHPLLAPVLEPLLALLGRHEELELHLLELPGAEGEVAGRDLVAEGLADLGDAERRLLARRRLHRREVHEDALGRLRAAGRRSTASSSTGPTWVLNIRLKLRASVKLSLAPQLGQAPDARQLVLPEPLLAVAAVDQGVGEGGHVARGLPHLRRHEDGGVEADDVVAVLDHGPPPRLFDVALEQHAEWPVVPGRPEPAVDLARREDETPAFGQVDDPIHQAWIVGFRRGGHDQEW